MKKWNCCVRKFKQNIFSIHILKGEKTISSTNRSKINEVRDEHIADYYVTPVKDIELFLKEFNKTESIFKDNIIILDPCGGGDTSHPMSYPTAIHNIHNLQTKTIDIREDSLADIKTDYLNYNLDYKPNIIITNPPFNLAMEII